jgi:hypothetical protein
MNEQWGKGPRLMAWLFGGAVAGAVLGAGTAFARDDAPQPPQPVYWQPQAIPPYEPTGSSLWFNESTEVWAIFAVIAVAITVMSAAGTFWIRWSATTDPAELAKVDPWLRANLEKYQAERQRPPQAGPGGPEPGTNT